ncbi:hypothetical protein DOTSEDRAFT_39715 [Dothistroma septosporum NZE10]|uniref:Uncharacterized protein n=1 Tax=Dothistroma septosporum (strain NZE10 / CBS 128990) TaxID=675120 RepID=M2WHV7_DOTSN|nr:hypothetical protein DOTSEDRAFT_39715 [Dothistroma septosporum NZE10]
MSAGFLSAAAHWIGQQVSFACSGEPPAFACVHLRLEAWQANTIQGRPSTTHLDFARCRCPVHLDRDAAMIERRQARRRGLHEHRRVVPAAGCATFLGCMLKIDLGVWQGATLEASAMSDSDELGTQQYYLTGKSQSTEQASKQFRLAARNLPGLRVTEQQ